ncbi:MAG: hypothetical protein ACOZAR_04980 [Patescibacteria group bacterium]
MDQNINGKKNIGKIILIVFVVLVVFIIFIGVIFKILYGQQSKPGDLSNNQISNEADLTGNASSQKNEPIEPESQEKIQNKSGLVNTGRLIQINKGSMAVKEESSGKMSDVKVTDRTVIYRWSLENGNLEIAKSSDAKVGQKVALSYFDEDKGNNEVSVMSIYPPFMVTGVVESIDSEKMIVNDTVEGKKYTANLLSPKVSKFDDSGQKVTSSVAEIAKGDRLIVYSDYDVEYSKSNFDAILVEIVVKNNAKLVVPDNGNQLSNPTDSNIQPVDVATPPPVGINPSGTLPGVQIGE